MYKLFRITLDISATHVTFDESYITRLMHTFVYIFRIIHTF